MRNTSSKSDQNSKKSKLIEAKKKILIKAIIAGEKSGFIKNFDPKKHLEKLHCNLK